MPVGVPWIGWLYFKEYARTSELIEAGGKMERLTRSFFARDSARVAEDLLGTLLVRIWNSHRLEGKVVETEAYYGEKDPPSHAASGKTERSRIMWSRPGLAYVYLIYGIHSMFNVVTEKSDLPGAVLIRAVEPLKGLKAMRKNRGRASRRELASGPGKLTEAFGIGKEENGVDLTDSRYLWFAGEKDLEPERIRTTERIGVSEAREKKLRFLIPDSDFTSE